MNGTRSNRSTSKSSRRRSSRWRRILNTPLQRRLVDGVNFVVIPITSEEFSTLRADEQHNQAVTWRTPEQQVKSLDSSSMFRHQRYGPVVTSLVLRVSLVMLFFVLFPLAMASRAPGRCVRPRFCFRNCANDIPDSLLQASSRRRSRWQGVRSHVRLHLVRPV